MKGMGWVEGKNVDNCAATYRLDWITRFWCHRIVGPYREQKAIPPQGSG
jgi:hypothetical protein